MVKPDDDTYKALARVSQSADWKLIEVWLQKCREYALGASFSADEVACRQAQGRYQALDQLLKETNVAESVSRR